MLSVMRVVVLLAAVLSLMALAGCHRDVDSRGGRGGYLPVRRLLGRSAE